MESLFDIPECKLKTENWKRESNAEIREMRGTKGVR